MSIARYHSYETCGTVDGPGIRFILFLQGCLMRCQYCHNRDTWDVRKGETITLEALMKEVLTYRHYMKASGGGVTASGGEAILQAEFVRDWFRACKKEGIHTCLDTNGFVRHHSAIIDEMLDETDLVLLDLKQLNNQIHKRLIGVSNHHTLAFAEHLQKRNIPTWIRYVVVPNYTDADEDIHLLGEFVATLKNVEKIDLLPYHKLGVHKWEVLGETYPLSHVNPPTKESLEHIKNILESYGLCVKY